ncbi:MAG: hypothetical protein V7K62_16950 [Nostoc sp.]
MFDSNVRCLGWSLSFVVPLSYGTLRERGSKLGAASRREVRATPYAHSNQSKPHSLSKNGVIFLGRQRVRGEESMVLHPSIAPIQNRTQLEESLDKEVNSELTVLR